MDTKTKSTRTEGLLTLFDYHSGFFNRVVEGISDADALNRLGTKANHIAWLAGSLVHQRYEMAKDGGHDIPHAGHELFKNNQGIKDDVEYPSLEQYKKDWEKLTTPAREALVNVTDEQLDGEIDMGGMKMKLYDMIAFTIYREASIIGQIALWRRLLGYEAMKYGG